MPSKSAETALRDMLYHIDLAARFVLGFDYVTFHDVERTVHAVTRCLEIISEASRRLPEDMKARYPGIEWKRIAGAGTGTTMKTWLRGMFGRRCKRDCRCCVPSSHRNSANRALSPGRA